jgi:hypothetical protein
VLLTGGKVLDIHQQLRIGNEVQRFWRINLQDRKQIGIEMF